MKSKKIFLSLILSFSFLISIIPIGTANINLQIKNGFYNEVLLANNKIDIWANPPSEEMIFDKWTGDTELITDPYSFHTSMDIPSVSANINATYKSLPENWELQNFTLESFNNTNVYYYFPKDYSGIIFLFHGRGGSATGWINENKTDQLDLIYRLVNRNYAIIVPESLDRINKKWDGEWVLENNIDIQHIEYIINNLTTRGLIDINIPYFGLGMSNGGGFVSKISAYHDFAAQTIFCSGGTPIWVRDSKIPTYWNLAYNDHFPNINPKAEGNYEYLITNGAFAKFYMNRPSPVHQKQFSYLKDITMKNSSEIYTSFAESWILGDDGFIVDNITSIDQILETIPDDYLFRDNSIKNSIMKSGAYHKFYSKNIPKVLNFFDAHNYNKTEFELRCDADFNDNFDINWSKINGEFQLNRYDNDGNFNLIWSHSAGADNYSIYCSDNPILDSYESCVCIANQNATSPFTINISNFNGEKYYSIIAHHSYGEEELSNSIYIRIGEESDGRPENGGIISFGYNSLLFSSIIIFSLITIVVKKIDIKKNI